MQSAVIYARVSSKEQEREGFSIDAQLRLLRDYADEEGFTILREFIEIETDKSTDRPVFHEMLVFLETNPGCPVIRQDMIGQIVRQNPQDVEAHLVAEALVEWVRENDTTELEAGMRALGVPRPRFKH